ncbi:TPA: GIY-YIG nuclease family protein, partial [Enterococcus faecium]|nr:GIY-YIG nuclease family protein [Enterococcus faecium]
MKITEEKEQQKAIKEQMIEEEKVRREIDREKKRIDKEQRQFNSEISKLIAYMQKANADVEKELYANKIQELEEKLKELEVIRENVLQRELNTRAGYVYVISNIGSFGEDIYKIGMTRRLEPMDRIKELSSASVPFEFDVHAMIFSEDAPSLETKLH